MADTVAPIPDTPDLGAAVAALWPRVQRYSFVALSVMVACVAATIIAVVYAVNLIDDGSDRFKAAGFAVILGVVAVMAAYRQMRRAQEGLVMPVVAQAVGLSYAKTAKDFVRALPPRLLPGQAIRTGEDYVYGKLGNHAIQMAEVKVETGGKNSRTLFDGLVAQFDNRVAMPAFFLAPHEQTNPGMIFRAWMPTDGLYHLRDVTGPSGEVYGLWTSWSEREEPPALAAVVKVLTDLETQVGGAELFSATSDGTQIHVALTHERNLYQIGGLFPDQSQLFGDVHGAARDLAVPLNIARQLIAAEEVAAARSA